MVRLSAAEKQRRYRERKAELGEAACKEMHNAAERLKRKMNPEAVRERHNLKQQKWRAAKRTTAAAELTADISAYSTSSSRKRAKRHAESALPKSPSKCRVIVSDIAAEYNLYPRDADSTPLRPPPHNKIPDEVRDCVQDFYQ